MSELENEQMGTTPQDVKLPENAYRELKEGEEYKPILMAEKKYPELNAWTIVWGIIMAIIFSAATAYAGLRFGHRDVCRPLRVPHHSFFVERKIGGQRRHPLRTKKRWISPFFCFSS